VDFRLLGPLEVSEDDRPLELGGAKQRALLAVLLLNGGEAVSADRLIDALWRDEAPASALNSVHIYVSQLRKALGDGRLVTERRGYRLLLEPEQLDVERFERLVAQGRELRAQGDAERASETLRSALSLWRGPALADFTYEPFAQTEIARLEELRLAALEERIDADLALGRDVELVPELEALVRDHPLRERLRGQLMLALYRSGRQAQALDVYRDGRRLLSDQLGLEPSPALRELEHRILNQDPALEVPKRLRLRARSRGPLLVVAGAAAALLAAIGAVVYAETREGAPGLASVAPNSVGLIDPKTNKIVAQVPVGGRPVAIATGLGAVWVANSTDQTVLRIDPETRRVTKTTGLAIDVSDLAVGAGAVWVAGGNDSVVVRLDRAGEIHAIIDLPTLELFGANPVFAVAAHGDSAWAAAGGGLYRIDPRTDRLRKPIQIVVDSTPPVGAAATSSAVWTVVSHPPTVVKILIGLASATTTLRLGEFLSGGIAADRSGVWVVDDNPATLWRIDERTSRVAGSVRVGRGAWDVSVGEEAVWTADSEAGTVSRIDPRTQRVVTSVRVGGHPLSVAVGYDAVWVGVGATSPFTLNTPSP
jgi:YVTN family beta-propeller protein